ncbi:uncharacterized protein TNCV_2810211 [Trichonephila clavipes]|nr:uncharacterized protein TNCV_2810211 [Trichonephila clavipes]
MNKCTLSLVQSLDRHLKNLRKISAAGTSSSEESSVSASLFSDGSNPREDIDVCKYIGPSRHGGTLNSRRAASPLVRWVEGEERWDGPDHPQGVLSQNWGGNELKRTVNCMVLKGYN